MGAWYLSAAPARGMASVSYVSGVVCFRCSLRQWPPLERWRQCLWRYPTPPRYLEHKSCVLCAVCHLYRRSVICVYCSLFSCLLLPLLRMACSPFYSSPSLPALFSPQSLPRAQVHWQMGSQSHIFSGTLCAPCIMQTDSVLYAHTHEH